MNKDFMRKAEMVKIGLENGSLKLVEKYVDGVAFAAYRENKDGFETVSVAPMTYSMVLGR